jgi:hypothetical protein
MNEIQHENSSEIDTIAINDVLWINAIVLRFAHFLPIDHEGFFGQGMNIGILIHRKDILFRDVLTADCFEGFTLNHSCDDECSESLFRSVVSEEEYSYR